MRAKRVMGQRGKKKFFFAFLCVSEHFESIETHFFFSKIFMSAKRKARASEASVSVRLIVSKFHKNWFNDDVIITKFLIFGAILQKGGGILWQREILTTTINLTGRLQVRFKSHFIILSYHNVLLKLCLLSKAVTPAERSCSKHFIFKVSIFQLQR